MQIISSGTTSAQRMCRYHAREGSGLSDWLEQMEEDGAESEEEWNYFLLYRFAWSIMDTDYYSLRKGMSMLFNSSPKLLGIQYNRTLSFPTFPRTYAGRCFLIAGFYELWPPNLEGGGRTTFVEYTWHQTVQNELHGTREATMTVQIDVG